MQASRSAQAAAPRMPAGVRASGAVQAFVFGAYRLDVPCEQLVGPRGVQVLRRKTFSVLRVLLEHAPAVVSLDQLLDAVWGRHAISPSAVPNVIVELRHALGDAAQSPRYIETRHRRGYRIVAVVKRVFDSIGGAHASPHSTPPGTHPLLAIFDDVGRSARLASPLLRLELLQRAASDRGLAFLALQAQLALQAHGSIATAPHDEVVEQPNVP